MGTHLRRGRLAVLLAVAGLLAWQPGSARAHPQLAGPWVSPTPPGGLMVYHFGTGCYLGRGIWRGPYTLSISHCPVMSGVYELRMFDDHQGTLATRDDLNSIGSAVGNLDLRSNTMILHNVTYHHRAEGMGLPQRLPPAP